MRAISDDPGSRIPHIPIGIGQVREQAFSCTGIIDIAQRIHNFFAQGNVSRGIKLE
jgi:hypothetical protein